MKSFRVYLKEPTVAPQRCVEEIPEQERQDLQDAFRPKAQSFRRTPRIAYVFVGGAFLFVALGFAMPKPVPGWVIGGFFICWLALASLIVLSPALNCPQCRNRLDGGGFRPYCPECGARALQPAAWPGAPHCLSCGREMRRRKTRHYRIRACTHCGVQFDDEGL